MEAATDNAPIKVVAIPEELARIAEAGPCMLTRSVKPAEVAKRLAHALCGMKEIGGVDERTLFIAIMAALLHWGYDVTETYDLECPPTS